MLTIIDRFLSLWIFLAIFLGLMLGILCPNIQEFWGIFELNHLNLLLLVCLILMMYPPLAKVEYSKITKIFESKKTLALSLLLNWIVGPSLMFALSYLFLSSSPLYMQGLIIIGLARCIAMVVVWSDLSGGNREYTSALVALNSIFQILFFSTLAYLFLEIAPTHLGISMQKTQVNIGEISKNTLIYLGIPFVLGFGSRMLIIKLKGKEFLQNSFLPKISPITLITLLFTIMMMCSYKASEVFSLPFDTLKIALPLALYFVIMFFLTWILCSKLSLDYPTKCSLSFTSSGNNFELAIAICIASFGINSPQAFVAVIGPLLEVPILVLLVKWALRRKP